MKEIEPAPRRAPRLLGTSPHSAGLSDVSPAVSNKLTNPKDMVGVTKLMLNLCSPIAKAYWAMAQFAGMLVNAGQDPTLFAGEVAALFSARCGRGPAAVRA